MFVMYSQRVKGHLTSSHWLRNQQIDVGWDAKKYILHFWKFTTCSFVGLFNVNYPHIKFIECSFEDICDSNFDL